MSIKTQRSFSRCIESEGLQSSKNSVNHWETNKIVISSMFSQTKALWTTYDTKVFCGCLCKAYLITVGEIKKQERKYGRLILLFLNKIFSSTKSSYVISDNYAKCLPYSRVLTTVHNMFLSFLGESLRLFTRNIHLLHFSICTLGQVTPEVSLHTTHYLDTKNKTSSL